MQSLQHLVVVPRSVNFSFSFIDTQLAMHRSRLRSLVSSHRNLPQTRRTNQEIVFVPIILHSQSMDILQLSCCQLVQM